MAQNDMTLANAAGAAFRVDLNLALQALAGLSSGTTAPTVTYAYQLWADTSANNVLKRRNAANTAWRIIDTLSEDKAAATKTAAFTVPVSGFGNFYDCSHATGFTVTLTAAATCGDGFYFLLKNSGTGSITLDANAAELIDGSATQVLRRGEWALVVCTGTAWVIYKGQVQESGSFTPVVAGATTAGTCTYALQAGRYWRVGNRVEYTISLSWSGHTGTGQITINGLPYTPAGAVLNSGRIGLADMLTYTGIPTAQVDGAGGVTLWSMASGAAMTAINMDANVDLLEISGAFDIA